MYPELAHKPINTFVVHDKAFTAYTFYPIPVCALTLEVKGKQKAGRKICQPFACNKRSSHIGYTSFSVTHFSCFFGAFALGVYRGYGKNAEMIPLSNNHESRSAPPEAITNWMCRSMGTVMLINGVLPFR